MNVTILRTGHLDQPYKFMYERLRDRAGVLDDAITKVGSKLIGDEEDREVLDLTSTHPDLGLALGRIQCDGEGRLNSIGVGGTNAIAIPMRGDINDDSATKQH